MTECLFQAFQASGLGPKRRKFVIRVMRGFCCIISIIKCVSGKTGSNLWPMEN